MRSDYGEEQRGFFSGKPLLLRLTLAVLFVAALAIRIYRIDEPPLDFHPVRQYFHALRLRSYYYSHVDSSASQWTRSITESQAPISDVMEPPIMEGLTLLLWWLTGGVHLWIPRLLSAIYWLAGGLVVYLLAKKVTCTDAAVISTAFYLLLPYGLLASRTFMRDPLMVMLLLCSVFTIVRHHERPTVQRVVLAGAVSALAILVKPISVFMVFGSFIALTVRRQGICRSLLDWRCWVFTGMAVALAAAFHGYPLVSLGKRETVGLFFKPTYLIDPFFYRNWLAHIQNIIGFWGLIAALLGSLMLRKGMPRALAAGLWCGYLLFGLAFTYHARTHDYYHLQLIPLVALCLGPVGTPILTRFDAAETTWSLSAAVMSILAFAMVLALATTGLELARQDFRDQARAYQEVGELVHHSTNTVCLDGSYGFPLQYHGWLACRFWPSDADLAAWRRGSLSDLSAEERFRADYMSTSPEYFIITDFQEFDAQPDLRHFLEDNYPLAAETDDYLIFNLGESRRGGK